MRKLYFLLLCFTFVGYGQNVVFNGANFKNKLLSASTNNSVAKDVIGNSMIIDANSDGEIQISEAIAVYQLDVSNAMLNNVVGISAFSNLTHFSGNNNYNIDEFYAAISSMPNLEYFNVNSTTSLINPFVLSNNNSIREVQISSVSLVSNRVFDNCPNLEKIIIDGGPNSDVQFIGNLNRLEHLELKSIQIPGFSANLPALKVLNLSGSTNLAQINLQNCPLLEELHLFQNPITALPNISQNPFLEKLYVGNHQSLTNGYDFTSFGNLKFLSISSDNRSNVDISTCVQLETLQLNNCRYTNLNLAQQPLLKKIYMNNVWSTGLNLTPFTLLEELDLIQMNQLTSLNISGLTNLKRLNFGSQNLPLIPVDEFTNLETLNYWYYPDASLNLTANTSLIDLGLVNSPNLQTVDASNLSQLQNLQMVGSTNINSLNIIGSDVLTYVEFHNVQNLEYICADVDNHSFLETYLNTNFPGNTVVIDDLCAVPSGNENRLFGSVVISDENGSCADGLPIRNSNLQLTSDQNNIGIYTFAENGYEVSVPDGNYQIRPRAEHPEYFSNVTVSQNVVFNEDSADEFEANFCMQTSGIKPDVEVIYAPMLTSVINNWSFYTLFVRNKGNQPVSGVVSVQFDASAMALLSSEFPPISTNDNTLFFAYENVLPNQVWINPVIFQLHNASNNSSRSTNQIVQFAVNAQNSTTESTPTDNQFQFQHQLSTQEVSMFATCLQGNTITVNQEGSYLHYVLRFPTYQVISDDKAKVNFNLNPSRFDAETFEIIYSENPTTVIRNGNDFEFSFKDLGSTSGSAVYVVFKVKTKADLQPNDVVSFQPVLFFNDQDGVLFPEVSSTISNLSTSEVNLYGLVVYPNPVADRLNIKSISGLNAYKIFDTSGRQIKSEKMDSLASNISIDVSNLQSGVYFLNVGSGEKNFQLKFIKQ